MSVLDDNIRQRFDRMHEKMAQDVTRTFDLIDKIKSGDVTGIELDEKSMRIPFKTFPADRISDDHTFSDAIHNAEVAMREKCAKIALDEKVSGETRTEGDAAYNQACEDIARKIMELR